MKMMEKPGAVRIGIIGLGGIARTHLEQCRAMGDHVIVQAAAEPDGSRRRPVCSEYGITHCYDDGISMMDQEELDGVIICVPPFLREPLIRCAVEKGIGVLCEKPLATGLEEGRRILDICRAHPEVPVLLNFKMRQGGNFQRAKQWMDKEAGRPTAILARYALVTDPDIWAPPRWFWDIKASGGLLIENAGHMIDYIMWIAGKADMIWGYTKQKSIASLPEDYMRKSQTEDHAVIVMEHEGGCTTTFVNTICYPGNRDGSIEIATSRGYFLEISECVRLRIRKGEEILAEYEEEPYGIGDGYTLKQFIEVLKGGEKGWAATAEDGYLALEAAVRARESARTGNWVHIREKG